MGSKSIVFLQHAASDHPGAIGKVFKERGIETRTVHLFRGESLPAVETLGGVISLGGAMGANDEDQYAWIRPECELLRQCVTRGIPVFGVCLGGQLLAKALGARVEKHSVAEIGWQGLQLAPLGHEDPVVSAAGPAPRVFQWHYDTFHLPEGAELLARSAGCPRQAYRIGKRAYGFQFHPEVDAELAGEWLAAKGTPSSEEQILQARETYGPRTVQSPEEIRAQAAASERFSRLLSAAVVDFLLGIQ